MKIFASSKQTIYRFVRFKALSIMVQIYVNFFDQIYIYISKGRQLAAFLSITHLQRNVIDKLKVDVFKEFFF